MHTENIRFKINNVNKFVLYNARFLSGKCWRNLINCYVLEHLNGDLWHHFQSYGFRKCEVGLQ